MSGSSSSFCFSSSFEVRWPATVSASFAAGIDSEIAVTASSGMFRLSLA